MSQTDFAALAGAKKGTQISWEKDASSPTAAALVSFADAGADVLYILTGQRSEKRLTSPHLAFGDAIIPGDQVDDAKRQLGIAADEELAAVLGYGPDTIRQWRLDGAISKEGRDVVYHHLVFRQRNEIARSQFSTIDASKRQFAKAIVIRYLIETTIEEDGDLEPDGLLFRAIEMDNFELAAVRLLDKQIERGAKNMLMAFRNVLATELSLELASEMSAMMK